MYHEVVPLVPHLRVNLTRYHGMFAPNSPRREAITPVERGRGAKCKASEEVEADTPAARRSAMTWAQRLKRVFGIDIEICTECVGRTTAEVQRKRPVNDRFQRLIASRAGINRRAAWFKREQNDTDDFPGLLVRDEWQQQADYDLCQRYLLRKAPRLLMLQSLSSDQRDRLEVAAKQHVFEVEQYYPMYPEVNDQRLMEAILVEARLRRAAPQAPGSSKKKESTTIAPLSKDMRIIEN